jgi:hypothetical protein
MDSDYLSLFLYFDAKADHMEGRALSRPMIVSVHDRAWPSMATDIF